MTDQKKRVDIFHKPTGDEIVHEDLIWSIPNLVTFIRLLCIPVFVWLLFGAERRYAAAWLLAFLGMTDWVDGYLARRLDQASELGRLLDPTVDRLMFIVGIFAMIIDQSVALWFAFLVLVREVLVAGTGLFMMSKGIRTLDVTWWGKTATFGLMVAFPLFLGSYADVPGARIYGLIGWIVGLPSLVASWMSAASYVGPALAVIREDDDRTVS